MNSIILDINSQSRFISSESIKFFLKGCGKFHRQSCVRINLFRYAAVRTQFSILSLSFSIFTFYCKVQRDKLVQAQKQFLIPILNYSDKKKTFVAKDGFENQDGDHGD